MGRNGPGRVPTTTSGLTIALQPRANRLSTPVACKRLSDRVTHGRMNCHTAVPKTKVALTLDTGLLHQVDELVEKQRFRNRSQAIEAALADKLRRLARTRLARESAKLNPDEERRLADDGLTDALDSWPEY